MAKREDLVGWLAMVSPQEALAAAAPYSSGCESSRHYMLRNVAAPPPGHRAPPMPSQWVESGSDATVMGVDAARPSAAPEAVQQVAALRSLLSAMQRPQPQARHHE